MNKHTPITPSSIRDFHGPYAFLSNFYTVNIPYQGKTYPSVEHAFQAAKCVHESDKIRIQQAPTPGIAKRIGRRVSLIPHWDETRISVMETLLREKFKDPVLQNRLIKTAPATLIEGNHWNDTFWGVCNDVGENHLGKLLMKIRNEYLGESLL